MHLKEHFLSRMTPELAQMVKRSCVTWKTCSLADILQHAEHAEDMLDAAQDKEKQSRDKKLEQAQLTMFNAMANMNSVPGPRGWRRDQRGRGRRINLGDRQNDPEACHNCGRRGHWRAACPEPWWRRPFPESD